MNHRASARADDPGLLRRRQLEMMEYEKPRPRPGGVTGPVPCVDFEDLLMISVVLSCV